jgi:sigma-E factor negative regulatory protein RseB
MSLPALRQPAALATFLFVLSPVVHATEAAYDWLMKMNQATRELTYDGTYVYHHDDSLEAMRIVHRVEDGVVQERLVSLNGAAREVIRDDRQVTCYLPDRQSVFVEHRLAREKKFPIILPERVEDLKKNYVIHLGKAGRVTGREAQLVLINPRDSYRYGYHLWADIETGLLLKANLIDHKGKMLEQFMFTQLNIGRPIDPRDLEPAVAGEGLAWYWGDTVETSDSNPPPEWLVERLPRGFTLANRIMRKNPTRNGTVEHLVYSDGLAAVSVFIEETGQDTNAAMIGPSRMGAVHAFGNIVNGRQVVVVGEVPAATVALIGKSVVAKH